MKICWKVRIYCFWNTQIITSTDYCAVFKCGNHINQMFIDVLMINVLFSLNVLSWIFLHVAPCPYRISEYPFTRGVEMSPWKILCLRVFIYCFKLKPKLSPLYRLMCCYYNCVNHNDQTFINILMINFAFEDMFKHIWT